MTDLLENLKYFIWHLKSMENQAITFHFEKKVRSLAHTQNKYHVN